MSNAIMNRQQRRAARAQARRAEKATIGSRQVDAGTRAKARRAFEIIKQVCSTGVGTRPHLYSRCIDGVMVFEALRRRTILKSLGPFQYGSLLGQQTAHLFAEATLDNVLAVLIEETPDRKWSWAVVADNGLIFGSGDMNPCASREEAEQGALAGLGAIGRSAEPAPDYAPEVEQEKKRQIRVNGAVYVVPKISDNPKFLYALTEAMRAEGATYEELLARFVNLVLVDGVENHPVALMMLANCGWTAVTREILEDFCAANGIDDLWTSSDAQNYGARHASRPLVH
jgi:hypothetical protein